MLPAGALVISSCTSACTVSRKSVKLPVLGRSDGISVLAIQVPEAYFSKSSPGLTVRSRAVRSTPNSPISGLAVTTISSLGDA